MRGAPRVVPQFTPDAAKQALSRGVSSSVASAVAIGAAAQTIWSRLNIDLHKFEIFRDFYQFLGIFFGYLSLPSSFVAFFGNVAALFSASFASLTWLAPSPVGFFWIVFAVTTLFYCAYLLRYNPGIPGNLQEKVFGKRLIGKDSSFRMHLNWDEINKQSTGRCSKFNRIKYLLLILTTLYAPMTKNAVEMMLCSPKYAYGKWQCMPSSNHTDLSPPPLSGHQFYAAPQELLREVSCIDALLMSAERIVLTSVRDLNTHKLFYSSYYAATAPRFQSYHSRSL